MPLTDEQLAAFRAQDHREESLLATIAARDARIADAYKAGAEDMRERAAKACDAIAVHHSCLGNKAAGFGDLDDVAERFFAKAATITDAAKAIRALPIRATEGE